MRAGPPMPPSLAPVQSVEPVPASARGSSYGAGPPAKQLVHPCSSGLVCILTIQAILSLRLIWSQSPPFLMRLRTSM